MRNRTTRPIKLVIEGAEDEFLIPAMGEALVSLDNGYAHSVEFCDDLVLVTTEGPDDIVEVTILGPDGQ
jgi:hypothetical protein